MTHTNTPPFFRVAIGLLTIGVMVGCTPADLEPDPAEGPPPTTPTVATGGVDESTGGGNQPTSGVDESSSPLPGGGEINLDAQWQSLGQAGGDGNDGALGGDGGTEGDGTDGLDDPCPATLGVCARFAVNLEVDLTALEAPEGVEVGAVSISSGQEDAFRVVENTCTGFEVSEGTGACSITVEFAPQQPGQYHAELLIDIPSHEVTEAIDLQRDATGPATALPTEPADGATASTESPEPVSPEPSVPGTIDPPVPPDPTAGGTAGPPVGPPDLPEPAPDFPVEAS
ncbi:hypothetical protein [Kocuria sabuli]|uniref:hypothetical protein n=1 Tax=Kocuria sabuli TaxID=3071448 RepID=UPI0034D65C44